MISIHPITVSIYRNVITVTKTIKFTCSQQTGNALTYHSAYRTSVYRNMSIYPNTSGTNYINMAKHNIIAALG